MKEDEHLAAGQALLLSQPRHMGQCAISFADGHIMMVQQTYAYTLN